MTSIKRTVKAEEGVDVLGETLIYHDTSFPDKSDCGVKQVDPTQLSDCEPDTDDSKRCCLVKNTTKDGTKSVCLNADSRTSLKKTAEDAFKTKFQDFEVSAECGLGKFPTASDTECATGTDSDLCTHVSKVKCCWVSHPTKTDTNVCLKAGTPFIKQVIAEQSIKDNFESIGKVVCGNQKINKSNDCGKNDSLEKNSTEDECTKGDLSSRKCCLVTSTEPDVGNVCRLASDDPFLESTAASTKLLGMYEISGEPKCGKNKVSGINTCGTNKDGTKKGTDKECYDYQDNKCCVVKSTVKDVGSVCLQGNVSPFFAKSDAEKYLTNAYEIDGAPICGNDRRETNECGAKIGEKKSETADCKASKNSKCCLVTMNIKDQPQLCVIANDSPNYDSTDATNFVKNKFDIVPDSIVDCGKDNVDTNQCGDFPGTQTEAATAANCTKDKNSKCCLVTPALTKKSICVKTKEGTQFYDSAAATTEINNKYENTKVDCGLNKVENVNKCGNPKGEKETELSDCQASKDKKCCLVQSTIEGTPKVCLEGGDTLFVKSKVAVKTIIDKFEIIGEPQCGLDKVNINDCGKNINTDATSTLADCGEKSEKKKCCLITTKEDKNLCVAATDDLFIESSKAKKLIEASVEIKDGAVDCGNTKVKVSQCGQTKGAENSTSEDCKKSTDSKCCLIPSNEDSTKNVCVIAETNMYIESGEAKKKVASIFDVLEKDVDCGKTKVPQVGTCLDASKKPITDLNTCLGTQGCCMVSEGDRNVCLRHDKATKAEGKSYFDSFYEASNVQCYSPFPPKKECGSDSPKTFADCVTGNTDTLRCCYASKNDVAKTKICLLAPKTDKPEEDQTALKDKYDPKDLLEAKCISKAPATNECSVEGTEAENEGACHAWGKVNCCYAKIEGVEKGRCLSGNTEDKLLNEKYIRDQYQDVKEVSCPKAQILPEKEVIEANECGTKEIIGKKTDVTDPTTCTSDIPTSGKRCCMVESSESPTTKRCYLTETASITTNKARAVEELQDKYIGTATCGEQKLPESTCGAPTPSSPGDCTGDISKPEKCCYVTGATDAKDIKCLLSKKALYVDSDEVKADIKNTYDVKDVDCGKTLIEPKSNCGSDKPLSVKDCESADENTKCCYVQGTLEKKKVCRKVEIQGINAYTDSSEAKSKFDSKYLVDGDNINCGRNVIPQTTQCGKVDPGIDHEVCTKEAGCCFAESTIKDKKNVCLTATPTKSIEEKFDELTNKFTAKDIDCGKLPFPKASKCSTSEANPTSVAQCKKDKESTCCLIISEDFNKSLCVPGGIERAVTDAPTAEKYITTHYDSTVKIAKCEASKKPETNECGGVIPEGGEATAEICSQGYDKSKCCYGLFPGTEVSNQVPTHRCLKVPVGGEKLKKTFENDKAENILRGLYNLEDVKCNDLKKPVTKNTCGDENFKPTNSESCWGITSSQCCYVETNDETPLKLCLKGNDDRKTLAEPSQNTLLNNLFISTASCPAPAAVITKSDCGSFKDTPDKYPTKQSDCTNLTGSGSKCCYVTKKGETDKTKQGFCLEAKGIDWLATAEKGNAKLAATYDYEEVKCEDVPDDITAGGNECGLTTDKKGKLSQTEQPTEDSQCTDDIDRVAKNYKCCLVHSKYIPNRKFCKKAEISLSSSKGDAANKLSAKFTYSKDITCSDYVPTLPKENTCGVDKSKVPTKLEDCSKNYANKCCLATDKFSDPNKKYCVKADVDATATKKVAEEKLAQTYLKDEVTIECGPDATSLPTASDCGKDKKKTPSNKEDCIKDKKENCCYVKTSDKNGKDVCLKGTKGKKANETAIQLQDTYGAFQTSVECSASSLRSSFIVIAIAIILSLI